MNTINSDSETTQSSASKFLLFIIIIVLFFIYFSQQDLSYTTRPDDFTFSEEETSVITSGGVEKRRTFFLVFLFSAIIFIKGKGYSLIIRDSLGLLILANLSWAMVSFFWADNPALTGRRIVLLFILNFTALSISMNVPLRQLPTIVLWVTAPIPIIGFLSEWSLGTSPGLWWFRSADYRFYGTMHAEGQAMNCAMLFLAAATMRGKGGRLSRVFFLGVMLAAAIFLVLTKARGPFIATIIAFGIFFLCTKKRSTVVLFSYSIIVILGILILVFGDALFPSLGSGIHLGRQESSGGLSGRVELWENLGDFVKERPILGYGLGGFWTEDRTLAIAESHRWQITESHSIYFDTVLDLGIIGLVIFLTLVIVACWRSRRMCVAGDEGGAFALSLLTLLMVDGLAASGVLGRGFVTLLLLVVLFGISLESQLQRARRVAANDQ